MPSNLLLFLPLLAGYLFLHTSYQFKYRAKTLEGHRLVFETALCGFVLGALARVILVAAKVIPQFDLVRRLWVEIAGDVPYFGTTVFSLGLGPALGVLSNLWAGSRVDENRRAKGWWRRWVELSKLEALRRAFASSRDEMKGFLNRAAAEELLVLLSMKDRKVYVGWVVNSPTPDRTETDLAVLPIYSGHRLQDSLRVVLDTPYPVEEYDDELDPEDFVVVLRLSEIVSARLFDEKVFRNHFEPDRREVDAPAAPGTYDE